MSAPKPAEIAAKLSPEARIALLTDHIEGMKVLAEVIGLMDHASMRWNALGLLVRAELEKEKRHD